MKNLDNEATIRIVQVNGHRWQIETRNGFVLQDNLFFTNNHSAEDYIKRYLSSYLCWTYEVVPLTKESVK